LSQLARVLLGEGDTESARGALEHALPIYENWYGTASPEFVAVRKRLEDLAS